MGMHRPGGLGAEVLGRILLLQSALHGLSDDARIADVLVAGISGLPGVRRVYFCREGKLLAHAGEGDFVPPETCRACYQGDFPLESSIDDCPFASGAGRVRLFLQGVLRAYGGVLIELDDAGRFEPYRGFLMNTANVAALLIENRMQWHAQEEMNRGLEREVEERTGDLRRSNAQLGDILRSISDGFFVLDKDLVVVYFNTAASQLLGRDAGEVVGRGLFDVFPEARGSVFEERYRRALREKESVVFEEYFGAAPYANWYSVRVYPRADGISVYFQVVTERKRAEAALRESEERFRGIFEVSPIGMAIVDVGTQGIEQANPALCGMLGYTLDEIRGLSVGDITHPEDMEREAPEFRRVLAASESRDGVSYAMEKRYLRKDGEVRWGRLTGTVLSYRDGLPERALGMVEDITEAKRVLEERRLFDLQMQQTQKLESLGVLAGGIAHDFNNLLMGILGNCDLAQMDLPSSSPLRPYLQDVETAARRAAGLCQQMLAYSGRGHFVIEDVDVNGVVEEMTHMLEISISKQVVLRLRLGSNLPAIRADVTQIRQVVMNLVINASEAVGAKSGVVSVTTGTLECDRDYLRETYLDEELSEGRYVFLEVADTGCGMDAETRSRMFDPFFTTKFTGRGLGMAAVLGIIRGHRGAIKVYSELGEGTTVKIMFPAQESCVSALRVAATAGEWRGEGTILLADDEDAVLVPAQSMLRRLGFDVFAVRDGREAVEVYRQHRGEIVCVVLDLTMPHMDGEETFRELRRMDRDVRVVVSSGYTRSDVMQRFLGKGISGFVQKPYQMAVLREVLESVLGRDGKEG